MLCEQGTNSKPYSSKKVRYRRWATQIADLKLCMQRKKRGPIFLRIGFQYYWLLLLEQTGCKAESSGYIRRIWVGPVKEGTSAAVHLLREKFVPTQAGPLLKRIHSIDMKIRSFCLSTQKLGLSRNEFSTENIVYFSIKCS